MIVEETMQVINNRILLGSLFVTRWQVDREGTLRVFAIAVFEVFRIQGICHYSSFGKLGSDNVESREYQEYK
jgi:hypothetical protein